MAIVLVHINAIILVAIDGYFIGQHLVLLMVIILVVISGYFINGYQWLLVVINGHYMLYYDYW